SLLLSRKAVLPLIVLAIAAGALAGRSIFITPAVSSARINSPTHELAIQPPAGPVQNSQIRTELITIDRPASIRLKSELGTDNSGSPWITRAAWMKSRCV